MSKQSCNHKFVKNKSECLVCGKAPWDLFPADEKDQEIDRLQQRIKDLEALVLRPVWDPIIYGDRWILDDNQKYWSPTTLPRTECELLVG